MAFALLALVALLGTAQSQRGQTTEECAGKVMDIFFVLDSSTSIYINDFNQVRDFTRNIIERFDVSSSFTRVGILTFSESVQRPILDFSRSQTKNDIVNSINSRNLPYLTGVTNTHEALRTIREYSAFRSDITKVVVVITDGGSRSPGSTAREAQLLRDLGFYMVVVGVGQYQEETEWRAIASDPDSQFIYNITNFRRLDDVLYTLPRTVCPLPPILLGYCSATQSTDLHFVATGSSTSGASIVINDMAERLNDNGFQVRGYFHLDICTPGVSTRALGLDQFSLYCSSRFGDIESQTIDFLDSMDDAINEASSNQFYLDSQILYFFIDTQTYQRYSVSFLDKIRTAEALNNVEVIVVAVDNLGTNVRFEITSELSDRDNLIEFQGGREIASQTTVLDGILDRTCSAIDERPIRFVPQ